MKKLIINKISFIILLLCTACSGGYYDEVLPKGKFEAFALDNGRVAINSTFNMDEGTKVRWDMGDGSKPIDDIMPVASPTRYYDYKKNGTFTITLYYWGVISSEDEPFKTGYIYLDQKTVSITSAKGTAALFSYAIDATNRLKVNFSNQSQNADRFIWKFGDDTESTDPSPSHTYAKTGKYTITLAAIRNNEADVTSQTIELK